MGAPRRGPREEVRKGRVVEDGVVGRGSPALVEALRDDNRRQSDSPVGHFD